MVINDDIDKKVEKFFRKRILQNLSSGIKLDGMTLINEAAFEFNLDGLEDGLALSIILNDVWEMMNLPKKENGQTEETETKKTELTSEDKKRIKFQILLHMYKDPYAPIEKIADDLNIDVDLIREFFGNDKANYKTRFSPKQKIQIVDTTLAYLSHFPNAVPEDLENIFFDMFGKNVDVRDVLNKICLKLEKKEDKKTVKILREFLKREPKRKAKKTSNGNSNGDNTHVPDDDEGR